MPLAKAFGVKQRPTMDRPAGQPRSLWDAWGGTAGGLEPEAARFIARQTGKHPVTGKPLEARPSGVSVDMDGAAKGGPAEAEGPMPARTIVLFALLLVAVVMFVELGPDVLYRWSVRLARWVVDNAVHDEV